MIFGLFRKVHSSPLLLICVSVLPGIGNFFVSVRYKKVKRTRKIFGKAKIFMNSVILSK